MVLRFRVVVIIFTITALGAAPLIATGQSGQYDFANQQFLDVWERTDLPIEQGHVSRTWIWGPGANTPMMQEPYVEADGGMRDVQYTDKSRKEMPVDPVPPDSDWFITQGLLATELMTGNLQLGDAEFEQHAPAEIPVAGDPSNNQSPTYAAMGPLIDEPPRSGGEVIIEALTQDGQIAEDHHTAMYGVTDAYFVEQTGNNIASVFWDFMNSSGTVYENGAFQHGNVFTNPFYAIGFPITEAYWGVVTVAGTPQSVLMQCFERRCLTYAPDNPEGWQVESGNIGQHYYEWRYQHIGDPVDDDSTDDTPPVSDDSDDMVSGDDDDSVERSWVYSLDPTGATSVVGETHTVTIHVRDQFDAPHVGVEVYGSVPFSGGATQAHVGMQLDPYPAITDSEGKASMSYTGVEPGTDTVQVEIGDTGFTISTAHIWEEDSSCVAPGQSIQEALDAAAPGDEVCVDPGTYNEALSITTPGVTLSGSNGAVLDGNDVPALDSIGISIEADDVTVENFEIRNFFDINIEIGEANDATLANLNLLSPAERTISVYGSPGFTLVNTNINPGASSGVDRIGISLTDVPDLHIDNVTIENADVGVRLTADLMSGSGIGPTGGTIENSAISAPDGDAIAISAAHNLTIRGNDISSGDKGIVLGNIFPQDIFIENNEIADSRVGIELGSATTSTISGNTLNNHEHFGVLLRSISETVLTGNTISGSGSGVRITEEDTWATITGNEFSDNTLGISVEEALDEPVTDNVFVGNNTGVQLAGLAEADLSGNLFTGNHYGLLVVSTANASLSSVNFNDFVLNDNVGIVNHDSSNVLNATMNFWGDHSGPSSHGGSGATGDGDGVSQNVDYDPWHLTPLTD